MSALGLGAEECQLIAEALQARAGISSLEYERLALFPVSCGAQRMCCAQRSRFSCERFLLLTGLSLVISASIELVRSLSENLIDDETIALVVAALGMNSALR